MAPIPSSPRGLGEIEQHLVEEDPDLDAELTNLTADLTDVVAGTSRRSRAIVIVCGIATFLIAATIIVVGVAISSPVLVVLGAVLTAGIPVGAAWRVWRIRRR